MVGSRGRHAMGKSGRRIITIIVILAAIGGIVLLVATQFPQLIPSHTIPAH